jgi:DNA-binding LytR/AlgR family response regulator
VNKKLDQLIEKLKDKLGLFLSLSFGMFIFVLFFQPFLIESSDFNNRTLVVAGLGAITFLIIVIFQVFIPWISGIKEPETKEYILPSTLNGFIIWVLNSLAFIFYVRYVGSVNITFYIAIKIIILCLAPSIILSLYDSFNELKEQNEQLRVEKKIIQMQVEKYEEDILNKSIEFISENISDNFTLLVGEVVYIKSADNYVEIVYKEGDAFKKRLIRNTLRNIELQIKLYTNFLRCHRICIVNVHFIERLKRDNGNHWLIIKGYDEQLPVSRQYLLKLQEAI